MRIIALVISGLLAFSGVAQAFPSPAPAGLPAETKRCGKGPKNASITPSEAVSDPVVTGPVTGGIRTGQPYGTTMVPLKDGWIEEEFFIEGTARTYTTATPTESAYKTRILLRRPTDPRAFNGTVILDWNNVTIPADRDVAWSPMYEAVMERGFVYVAVAAQRLGVEASPLALKQWDPVRYGSLNHPGDDYSFDIFSQAGEATLEKQVLGKLVPCIKRRIAMGASQSGGRLKTYINEVHEEVGIYDGFSPQISSSADVRRDLVPILWVNSMAESDDEGVPADSDLFRLWEIAGAAHTSNNSSSYQDAQWIYNHSNGATGSWDAEAANSWGYLAAPGDCLHRNWYQAGLIWSSSLVTLDEWLRTGVAPEPMPRIERDENGVVFDEHGVMKGGLRTPIVDVPIASYFAGVTMPPTQDPCGVAGGAAALVGTTRVFTAEQLAELYPTPEDYLEKFNAATDEALANGHILPSDAERLRERAKDAADFIAQATG
ncbi:MAG TPA: alpha/beta hydrolase domain-containing protein [Actinomycetota bacterium]|nr:alpha/beta hydrolase domain-containing protein [Actinomycetota bacterium]